MIHTFTQEERGSEVKLLLVFTIFCSFFEPSQSMVPVSLDRGNRFELMDINIIENLFLR